MGSKEAEASRASDHAPAMHMRIYYMHGRCTYVHTLCMRTRTLHAHALCTCTRTCTMRTRYAMRYYDGNALLRT